MSKAEAKGGGRGLFDDDATWADLDLAEQRERAFGQIQAVADRLQTHEWLGVRERVSTDEGFFHWKLMFATVFAPWKRLGGPSPVVGVDSHAGLRRSRCDRQRFHANAGMGQTNIGGDEATQQEPVVDRTVPEASRPPATPNGPGLLSSLDHSSGNHF